MSEVGDAGVQSRHVISNLNAALMVGDCMRCGPGVELARRGKGLRCARAIREQRRVSSTGRLHRRRVYSHGLADQEAADLRAWLKRCDLCLAPVEAVDHDHATGEIRGGLCRRCNYGLSLVEASDWLAAAIAYLADPPARRWIKADPPTEGILR